MDKNTKAILESVDFIKTHMVTKDDVHDIVTEVVTDIVTNIVTGKLQPIHEQLTAIEADVRDIKKRFTLLDGRRHVCDHLAEVVRHGGFGRLSDRCQVCAHCNR
jgi:hypothetical protein